MDHIKLGLDASLIEATKAILEKNLQPNQEPLVEATVETNKYSWGTMKVVHHGSSFSIPLHPEQHQAIAKLKDGQEHKFKDETGRNWTARRKGNKVHFNSDGMKTNVPHSTMMEEVELDEMKHMGSYTKSHVIKKIRAGEWEADSDVVPNRYVQLRKRSGKKIMVRVEHDPVKEEVELDEAGPFSYGAKKPRKGSVAYNIMMQRKEQEKKTAPIEPKDQMVGNAKLTKEEIEALDELSKATLKSYVKKASHDATSKGIDHGIKRAERDEMDRTLNRHMSFKDKDKIHDIMKTTRRDVDSPREKALKRLHGISRAVDKLTREQLEEIEALAAKHGLTKD